MRCKLLQSGWTPSWSWRLLALSVVSLSLLLYGRTLLNPPVWDDVYFVAGQPFLRDCGNLGLTLNPRYLFWVLPVENSARPAWLASVLCDSCLFPDAWPGLRLTSILWHGLGGVLLMALAWELSRDRWCSLLAGLIFVAHPLHTEPVNLITFRADLMAFAFMALSLCLYLRGRLQTGWRGAAAFAASLGCYAAAVLSKEMAVSLPALMILADALLPRIPDGPGPAAPLRGRWARYGLYALVLILFIAFRAPRSGYVLEPQAGPSRGRPESSWLKAPSAPEWDYITRAKGPPPDFMPWGRIYREPEVRFLTMSRISGSYLRLLSWPWTLQGDYAPPVVDSWADAKVLAAWLAWLTLLAAAWMLRRSRPVLSFGLLWIPVTLLPVSGIIPLLNLQADRYLYVPSAGWCLAAAAALSEAARARRRWLRAAAWSSGLGLLAFFGWRTNSRNRDYRDELAFYQATDRLDPGIPRNHVNLALTLQRAGQTRRAEAELRSAVRLWPGYTDARLLLAEQLMAQDRPADAMTELREGLPWGAKEAEFQYALGRAHEMSGRLREALAAYEAAAGCDPAYWSADLKAGELQVRLGRFKEGSAHLRQALATTRWGLPEGLYYLALAYRGLRMPRQAARTYAVLLRASPRLAAAYREGRSPGQRMNRAAGRPL
ncbi:MAG: tetratricopeptide repeat protein [Elusimicrobia bacterium]|nr:tetratricopeptide repeat protein [Elusimicrobiota bacterium]